MGVDATLFVIADYSSFGVGYVQHVFRLQRDRDLWDPLEQMQRNQKHRTWPTVQLPCGSWSNYSGEVPEGWEDRESGHLQSDCYGNVLDAFRGRLLADVKREEAGSFPDWDDSFNRAVFAFIAEHFAEHFAEHDVIVFWS